MVATSFEFMNRRYLLSIIDEPKQLLQPIFGYAHEPLVSLEEACEPLLDIVPRLKPHIWVAKENSKAPSDGLTQDESAAIRLYTMEWDADESKERNSLYVHLNEALQEVNRTKLRPWFRYLKLFLTALAKLPPASRQTVWRGVRKDLSGDYSPGTELTWWAFSSCTTSLSVLESDLYLGNSGTRTLFSVEIFNGRTIRAHSHFQVEEEILLLPGTYFEVKSRLNPAPDLHIVHLQQKRPPHDLLEPPFEGAELLSPSEPTRDGYSPMTFRDPLAKQQHRTWYKTNKGRFCIAAIITAALILAIVLGVTLGTRNKKDPITAITTTMATDKTVVSTMSFLYNESVPKPVYIADAFYAFDSNTLDLYSRRDGKIIGGSVHYVEGYIAYGKAISFDQSIPTKIQIQPDFNLNADTSFTIEGFFMLYKTQMYSTLVQLMPTIALNLSNSVLSLSLGSNIIILGTAPISTDQWHHFACVYDAKQQIARLYIDGNVDALRTYVKSEIVLQQNNSLVIVGAGFDGCIDQLSIVLKAKSPIEILWDATVVAYYPLEEIYLLDKGPNGINATSAKIVLVNGWLHRSLNFNLSGSYFQATGLTALGTPRAEFTIALWVRAESQGGIFLTVANPYTCLFVLGLQTNTNRLFAYLPNATASGTGVTIFGAKMPLVWVHVALTWSFQNGARLYSSGYLQNSDSTATTLNNVRGDKNSSPMTIRLGYYNGTATCQSSETVDSSQVFIGSLDELYVFSRELQRSEINEILTPPKLQ